MLYINEIKLKHLEINLQEYYNEIPAIKNLDALKFNKNITFFVGENGTGKSTLLEAIAVKYGFNPEGGSKNYSFMTNDSHSKLSEELILVKGFKQPKDGFFLRAESFYNVASELEHLIDSPNDGLLNSYGGRSLHQQSHGESFFSLMLNRFWGKGLYLLDEPEAAISPQKLLSVIILIHKLAKEDSQFIIATHSPILLGMEDADIYSFDEDQLKLVDYEETSSYLITKSFVNNRFKMLKNLLEEE